MNDKVEHLLLEHMRMIRADISSMKDEMTGMRNEMIIVRQHMGGLLSGQALQDGEIATLKVRLDRIEKRLEIVQ